MRKSSSVVRASIAAGLVAASLSLTGCISGSDGRHAEFLGNPSPEIDTFALTAPERSNRRAITVDTNFRRLNHDIDKILLLDRPRRGDYPIPY